MFIDIVGILLTILIVSPRYWFIVLIISCVELFFSILFSLALKANITEVIAGGVFNFVASSGGMNVFLQLLGPIFLLLFGFGLNNSRKIPWIDLLNPLSDFKRPWPVMMIKTAIFRAMFFLLFFI